jgi:hypothetical protein
MQTPSHGTPDDSLFEEELSSSLSPVFLLRKKARDARSEFNTLIDAPQTPETEEKIKQLMSQLERYQVIIKIQKDIFFVLHEMNCDSLIFNFYID